jgi:hypothetical protein
MTALGLVRLVAATELYRSEGMLKPGTRFLAAPAEARQLLQLGIARPDEPQREFRAPGPWPVRARR